jgi:hypothetical protein
VIWKGGRGKLRGSESVNIQFGTLWINFLLIFHSALT